MGKSSKDKRDIYYRLAKEDGWRARSAYKLLQLDENFDIFKNVSRVVDLCAAPGSWSQVLSKSSIEMILAIDLQLMSPIEGVTQIQADITKQSTIDMIMEYFGNNMVDLVVCDGAPDVTGLHDFDSYVQIQLIEAAINVASKILVQGGSFISKFFRSDNEITDGLIRLLMSKFGSITFFKPRASRCSSFEIFVVCQDFGSTCQPSSIELFQAAPAHLPDSDKTYSNIEKSHPTVSHPSIPPYKDSLNYRRNKLT